MRLPSGNIWRIFSYALATGLALGLLCYGLISFVNRQFTPGPELGALVALGIGLALGWFLFIAGKLVLRLALYDLRHTAAEITEQPVEHFVVGKHSDEFEVLRATLTQALARAPNSHFHSLVDQPAATLDLPQRFADAMAQLAARVSLAGAALLLYDADRAVFVPTLAWNVRLSDENVVLSADEDVVRKALREPYEARVSGGEAQHVLSLLDSSLLHPDDAVPALVSVALMVGDAPIGVLFLIGVCGASWSAQERELVRHMTNQLTPYVQEVCLIRDLTLERERFETLTQLAIALPQEPQLEKALERTLRAVAEATNTEHGTLLLLDTNEEIYYRIALTQGTLAPLHMVARSVLRNGLAGWTLRERRATLIADTQRDTRWIAVPGLGEMRSALAVPLIYGDQALGVLTLAHSMPGHYSPRTLILAEALTAQLAHILAYARIGELLEQQPSEMTIPNAAVTNDVQPPHVAQAIVLKLQLRHFASASERLDPAVLIDQVLAPYTKQFTAAVQAQQGYVDRCDETMAVAAFGYPHPAPDAATRALLAAVELQHALQELRAHWRTQLHCDLSFGIGVAQGMVTVGLVEGGPQQTFVLVGAAVNQAQRLQELARHGEVLCSAAVAAALREQFNGNGPPIRLQALQPLHTRTGDEQPYRLLTREDRVYDTH